MNINISLTNPKMLFRKCTNKLKKRSFNITKCISKHKKSNSYYIPKKSKTNKIGKTNQIHKENKIDNKQSNIQVQNLTPKTKHQDKNKESESKSPSITISLRLANMYQGNIEY